MKKDKHQAEVIPVQEDQDKPTVTVKPASGIALKLDYDIDSDRRINLTHDKAVAFLELDTFQGERNVNERHVQRLYNAFASGRFMWEHVIIATCKCDGKLYRVNGQHTCWMRLNAPKDAEAPVREIVYSVSDEHGLRDIYATFDQNKSRTSGHIMKALLIGNGSSTDLWPSKVGEYAMALRFWLYPWEASELSVQDVAQLIESKYSDLFNQVGLFYQEKYDSYKNIRRKPVMAAMFATFESAPRLAVEFWNPVCDAIGFTSKEDARWHLRRFLDTHSESRKSSTMKTVPTEDFYRVCIAAWNRWRKGEKVQSLRPTDKRLKAV